MKLWQKLTTYTLISIGAMAWILAGGADQAKYFFPLFFGGILICGYGIVLGIHWSQHESSGVK